MNSERLNLLECSGPVQGLLYLYIFTGLPFLCLREVIVLEKFLSVSSSCVSIVASWIIRLKSFARPRLDCYVMFPPERWLPFGQVDGYRSMSSGMSC